jgi:hypothetical protein
MPHCTADDVRLVVSVHQSGATTVEMDFYRTSSRTCSFPTFCNVIFEAYDASGREIGSNDGAWCQPQWEGAWRNTYESHSAFWTSCIPPGSYRVHASWTSEWQGTTTFTADATGGDCSSPSASPSPAASATP